MAKSKKRKKKVKSAKKGAKKSVKKAVKKTKKTVKKAAKKMPIALSAVSGAGVKEALYALAREINRTRKGADAETAKPGQPWRP